MTINVFASPADGVDLVLTHSTDFELFLLLFGRVRGIFMDCSFSRKTFVF